VKIERFVVKHGYLLAAAGFAAMLLSLKYGFLDGFLASTWHGRQGCDFFAIPRAFENLLNHKSIYNSWAGGFGPYTTWYPYHPALSVFLGSWLSLFKPWAAYAAFVVFSSAILICCGYLISIRAENEPAKKLAYFFLLCSPAAYLMLWAGQAQVLVVLSSVLIMAGLLDAEKGRSAGALIFFGILASLFSKPAVLAALPAIFSVRQCRRAVLYALAVYAAVSLAFLVVPSLNPQAAGFDKIVDALLNPERLFERKLAFGTVFLSYRPEFLFDNSIHWLNMRNLSQVVRADNFEFVSVSGFFTQLAPGLKPWLFKIPTLLLLAFSAALFFMKEEKRPRAALYCFVFSMLAFYIGYDSVYEYHYVPLLAAIPVFYGGKNPALKYFCLAGALFYVPTSYFWVRNPAFGHHTALTAQLPLRSILLVIAAKPYDFWLPAIRLMRVLPVIAMFMAMSYIMVIEMKENIPWRKQRSS